MSEMRDCYEYANKRLWNDQIDIDVVVDVAEGVCSSPRNKVPSRSTKGVNAN